MIDKFMSSFESKATEMLLSQANSKSTAGSDGQILWYFVHPSDLGKAYQLIVAWIRN